MLSLVGYMNMTGNNPFEEGNNLAACGLEILPCPPCPTFGVSDLPSDCALHLSHVIVARTGERGIPLSLKWVQEWVTQAHWQPATLTKKIHTVRTQRQVQCGPRLCIVLVHQENVKYVDDQC